MAQYINKSAVMAEIERRRDAALMRQQNLETIEQETILNGMAASELNRILSFLGTIDVKELNMPALDNGNMPIERWHEAVQAASNQANYRKSQGFTETCDDYFVDGVQWADEHPAKIEVDLDKEIDSQWKDCTPIDEGMGSEFANIAIEQFANIAKHFFNLGLNARKEE